MPKLALVTGASGFMAPYLVDELVRAGWAVRTTSRRRPHYLDSLPYQEVSWSPADLTQPTQIPPLLEGVHRVYHVAGRFDFFATAVDLRVTNAEATDTLCGAARRAGVKQFVYFSTGAVYGFGHGNRAVTETAVPNPGDPYATSKWEGELRAFQHNGKDGLEVLIVRPAAVYGPGSIYGDAQALYLLKKGFLCIIPGWKEAVSSHVHVIDCMAATHHLADRPESYHPDAHAIDEIVYNIADDTPVSNQGLIREAARRIPDKGLLGLLPLRVPAAPLLLVAWLAEWVARLTRTRPPFELYGVRYMTTGHAMSNGRLRESGYVLQQSETLPGIAETIDWYERTGWRGFRRKEIPPLALPLFDAAGDDEDEDGGAPSDS